MNGAFWGIAFALIAATWAVLWSGSRRAAAAPGSLPGHANVRMLDEALAALHADLARGAIDPARHARARDEIEHRLLDEAPGPATPGAPAGSPRLLAALALVLPALAASGYLLLGNPAALSMPAAAEPGVSADDVQAMVETLAQRLRNRPPGSQDDLQGWVMLARSYAALQRFDDAAGAYERAVALAPNDASLLADLADVLAMRNGLRGTPHADERSARLIERALQIDPNNVKALALAGSAAFERHDTAGAIDFWRRARALVPAGNDFAAGLDQSLADALGSAPDRAGPAPATAAAPAMAAAPAPAADPAAAAATAATPAETRASVHGQVRIAPALADRVAPGDTVFIFARALNGPPMPLAVLRLGAGSWPVDFTLDDSLAMAPALRLSNFGARVVGARVSHSGNALPQPGDLIGQAEDDASGRPVSITIDRVQP